MPPPDFVVPAEPESRKINKLDTGFRRCDGLVVVSSSMAACLACAGQIADAASTQAWMPSVGVDIVAVMPAALAFLCRARRDFHAVGVGCDDACLRGDQHEAQIVAQWRQQYMGVGAGMQRDLGLQRRADATSGAQGFQFFLHFGAYCADTGPAVEQVRCVSLPGEVMPGMQEYRIVLGAYREARSP